LGALNVATIANHVDLSLWSDFEQFSKPNPPEAKLKELDAQLNQLVKWAKAMRSVRNST
jgi:hypothetical protein